MFRTIALTAAAGAVVVGSALNTTAAHAEEPPLEPPACSDEHLSLSIDYIDSGMSKSNHLITAENVSDETCSVMAHPEVRALDMEGWQMGEYAEPKDQDAGIPLEVAPGESAWATLQATNPEVYGVPSEPSSGFNIKQGAEEALQINQDIAYEDAPGASRELDRSVLEVSNWSTDWSAAPIQ